MISADVFLNSDGASRRGSNGVWASKVVRIAELSTAINDLKEEWNPLVKLHNPARNAIHTVGEGQGQKQKHERFGGSGGGKLDLQN
jgi:hypothetical protein